MLALSPYFTNRKIVVHLPADYVPITPGLPFQNIKAKM